jgi:hypothetical protein
VRTASATVVIAETGVRVAALRARLDTLLPTLSAAQEAAQEAAAAQAEAAARAAAAEAAEVNAALCRHVAACKCGLTWHFCQSRHKSNGPAR